MIGGSGERKTLRLVARYADACNLFGADPATVRHKLELLSAHCEDAGRDPRTVMATMIHGSDPLDEVDRFLAGMEEYAALGIEQVWVSARPPDPVAWVSRICEQVLPRLRDV